MARRKYTQVIYNELGKIKNNTFYKVIDVGNKDSVSINYNQTIQFSQC